MNRPLFSDMFYFVRHSFEKYSYTDNRAGAKRHYLAYLEEGNARIVTKTQTLCLSAGDIFYIPKDLPYQSYWFSDNHISFHSYGFSFFPDSKNRDFLLQKIDCDASLTQQITSIPLDSDINCEILAQFFTCLSLLLPMMQSKSRSHEELILDQAEQYLIHNPHCSIADVAKHCCVSEAGLYTVFSRTAGMTPNCMRQKVLVDKAKHLLSTTDLPVQEISSTLHFSSVSYFRKIVKQHTGKTPRPEPPAT